MWQKSEFINTLPIVSLKINSDCLIDKKKDIMKHFCVLYEYNRLPEMKSA